MAVKTTYFVQHSVVPKYVVHNCELSNSLMHWYEEEPLAPSGDSRTTAAAALTRPCWDGSSVVLATFGVGLGEEGRREEPAHAWAVLRVPAGRSVWAGARQRLPWLPRCLLGAGVERPLFQEQREGMSAARQGAVGSGFAQSHWWRAGPLSKVTSVTSET